MKEFSFKNLKSSINIQSTSQLQPRNCSFGGKATENDQRIQMIRRKYDSPSPCIERQMKKSQLNQPILLRQSVAHNRSTIFQKNCQYAFDESRSTIRNTVSEQLKSQNQENILQKFQEMKQSILQERNTTLSWNRLKLEKEKNEKIQKVTYSQQTNINPRMENIDKINSKIKHILSYLHVNGKENLDQSEKKIYFSQQSRCSYDQQALKNSFRLDQSNISKANYVSNISFPQNRQKKSEANSYESERSVNMSFSKRYNESNVLKSYQSIQINKNIQYQEKDDQKTTLSHKQKGQNQFRNFRKNGHQKLHSQSFKLDIQASQKKNQEQQIYVTKFESRDLKNTQDPNNQAQLLSNQRTLNNINCKSSRSKSYIQSKVLNKFAKEDDCKSDISQKVDDQIKRIQKRIKDFEEEKRKLNIEFKPYEHTKKSGIDYSSKSNYKKDMQPPIKRDKSISYFKRQTQPLPSSSILQPQPKRNSQTSKISPSLLQLRAKYKMDEKKQKNQTLTISPSLLQLRAKYKIDDNKQKNYLQQFQMRRKADEGIEQRRRLLNLNKFAQKKDNNDTVKKLVQALQQQVALDEQYRNAKSWFTQQFDEQKWKYLQKQLIKQQISLSPNELKNAFSLLQQQNNPFFSITQCKESYYSLADKYKRAQQFWRNKIEKKFSKEELEAEKFTNSRIDLEKKGYIQLEDLVRFMNMETGTFSRNRDLIMIFKRLSSNNGKLTFQKMMKQICRE